MKKIFLIFVGIVLVAIALIIVFTLKTKWLGKWKVYENSRYSFRVDYPSNWRLGEESINNDGRVFSSPENNQECRAYGFFNALANPQGEPQDLKEFINWLLSEGNVKVINREQAKLSGNDAILLITQEDNLVNMAIYALGKESGRGLVCTFDNIENQQKFVPTFERMISSFEINVSLDEQ